MNKIQSALHQTPNDQSSIQGKVHCVHVSRSRPLRALVRRRLERLVRSRAAATPVFYDVIIRRIGEGHDYLCQLDVQWDGKHWSVIREGNGVHEALQSAVQAVARALSPPALALA